MAGSWRAAKSLIRWLEPGTEFFAAWLREVVPESLVESSGSDATKLRASSEPDGGRRTTLERGERSRRGVFGVFVVPWPWPVPLPWFFAPLSILDRASNC